MKRGLPSFAALLLLGAPAGHAAASERPDLTTALRASVRFFSPSAGDVAYGPTHVRVAVSPPPGTVARHVIFYVDGHAILTDRVPPYEMLWNAGERMSSHTLRAVASFSDDTAAEDTLTTRGLDLSEHEVVEGVAIEHTELLVSVVDRAGEPIGGLGREDFRLKDSGDAVEIASFERLSDRKTLPLSIAVLVDRSGSMRLKMDDWRKACVVLLAALRPLDQVRVSAFAEETSILQDFTRDAVSLATSLERVGGAGGTTRLYRSVFETMRDMRDLPGRKAIFVLTDGLDTEFSGSAGLAQEKLAVLLGALERLASRAGVAVITVFPGPSPQGILPIQKLSAETGGWWSFASGDLGGTLQGLARQLLGGYMIGYDVSRTRAPDRKRSVQVSLAGAREAGWEIHTSMGAYGRLDLEDALEEDLRQGSPAQRVRAATELGRIGSERGTAILIEALRDPDPGVRRTAIRTLAESRNLETLDKILKRAQDEDWNVREAAFDAAVRFGSPAIPFLSKIARKTGPARDGALRALGATGEMAVLPDLAAALRDDSCLVRAAAADGIGFLLTLTGGNLLPPDAGQADESAAPIALLEKTLDDACPEAADAAAIGLGRLAHPAALERLVGIAAGTQPTSRRGDSLLTLTSYLSPETFLAVEQHLVSDAPISPQERRNAAALYAAALRATRWLGTKEGLARIADLGVVEALEILAELSALGDALQADAAWRASIQELLDRFGAPAPAAKNETAPDREEE